MNAELWSIIGNERNTIETWLIRNKIEYNENASTEELIELYRKVECGHEDRY